MDSTEKESTPGLTGYNLFIYIVMYFIVLYCIAV
jgi:hypothetical protein